jgi:biopolymer transport protein ExbB/TolQ
VLGTLGNSCPFIGLFGTVVGIIKAFHDLAVSGSGGPTVVAAGIAEALVSTAAGLAVAIPCVVFFNYFMRKVKTMDVEMEAVSKRFLTILSTKGEETAGRKH